MSAKKRAKLSDESASASSPASDASEIRRPVKRKASSHTLQASYHDAATDMSLQDVTCQICRGPLHSPLNLPCRHTFCSTCLDGLMRGHEHGIHMCPTPGCGREFSRTDMTIAPPVPSHRERSAVTSQLLKQADLLSKEEIEDVLDTLRRRQHHLVLKEKGKDAQLCHQFLASMLSTRKQQIAALSEEISVIEADLTQLDKELNGLPSWMKDSEPLQNEHAYDGLLGMSEVKPHTPTPGHIDAAFSSHAHSFSAADSPAAASQADYGRQRFKLAQHHEDLESQYFDKHKYFSDPGQRGRALQEFRKSLQTFSKFDRLDRVCQLKHAPIASQPSIISSIEFDKDREFFATAGVTKEIKIYSFPSLVETLPLDGNPPQKVVSSSTKISCLCWNSFFKSQLASTDYTGMVQVWDVAQEERIAVFNEHEKRAWSIDFAKTEPYLAASGADDSKVKLWSTRTKRSVATIPNRSFVCCVQFSPTNSNILAFGASDHLVHLYDLRNTRRELLCFEGHAKTVSYVKFFNDNEVVSASTDSTLKLWTIKDQKCVRSFTGHSNDRNFVGLSLNGDLISCGSENNSVYVYYKGLSRPMTRYSFQSDKSGQDEPKPLFVSSVCWREGTQAMLAANSQGNIHVRFSLSFGGTATQFAILYRISLLDIRYTT